RRGRSPVARVARPLDGPEEARALPQIDDRTVGAGVGRAALPVATRSCPKRYHCPDGQRRGGAARDRRLRDVQCPFGRRPASGSLAAHGAGDLHPAVHRRGGGALQAGRPAASVKQGLTVEALLGPSGLLADVLPGYERRPQQLQMAQAVERCFGEHGYLLAEAGPGTGKTFAYLMPAVLSGREAVISTATNTFQD